VPPLAASKQPKILILTTTHGASHRRASNALRKALLEIRPALTVEVEDALQRCTRWFRAYYSSYEIPLKYWPSLWSRIEGIQHQSKSTGPGWLYRRGAQPLFRFMRSFDPDIVVATEVGVGELASMLKREGGARFRLVGVELMDFNQAWVQPEIDLYLVTHEDLGAELVAAGADPQKVLCSGQPLDPVFASLPPRESTRARLGLNPHLPVLLALFGGTGFGKPRIILEELRKVPQLLQVIFIAGQNLRLEQEARECCARFPRARALGWVDNIQEWMVAADLMLSKPGGATLTEGFACGLPMLAFEPLPGNERRTCAWIERWGVGHWVKRNQDLAPAISRLLSNGAELEQLRERARALARPRAAYVGAEAILNL
jgi:processive 1,2-diacylglycerol beta-glucosyltransferase